MMIRRICDLLMTYNLLKTLYFNLQVLPFKDALKLPILIGYHTKFISLKGTVEFLSPLRLGMVKFGVGKIGIFDKRYQRTLIELKGKIVFENRAEFRHGSRICVMESGVLTIGDSFVFNISTVICAESIKIGNRVTISWDSIIMDTDFHSTLNTLTGEENHKVTAPVVIGHHSWIGMKSSLLKGTQTPNWCIVGAGSLLNKKYDIPEKSLLAGNPATLRKENIVGVLYNS